MVTITTIAPSSTSLKVTVSAPASSGGQPITTYEYSLNGGLKWRHRTAGSTSRIIVISSLSRHHTYEVAIRAVNAVGPGAPSNVVAATTT